jgi:hypothetical protein
MFSMAVYVRRARRARGLVITSHRTGLLPTLVECETSVPLLRAILDDLHPEHVGDSAEDLFTRHRGNVRDALRELYDVCASRHIHVGSVATAE